MRQLIAGNWKMNGLASSLDEIRAIRSAVNEEPVRADLLICPPATLLSRAVAAAEGIPIGGQDCHAQPQGAYTGDISAEMLRDAGATAVIVGHSERRQYHGETSGVVAAKALAARRASLMAIICVGESASQRMAGRHSEICTEQIRQSVPDGSNGGNLAVAYEPVWAIGTGRTPAVDDIIEMHVHLRACLSARFGPDAAAINILYGGSVTPSNAAEILSLAEVGGVLVGGASLKAEDFLKIARSARRNAR